MPDPTPAAVLVPALSAWFAEHARELPWRSEPTPYRVLLSEFMLQQTRVETVLPYFDRFVTRWPTLEDLAAAPDDEVLAAWAGLGYYSRARRLLATARAAVALGGLPDTVDELLGLPGIGPYTAGAIASIAFGRPAPLVDGNVERVICRLDRRQADPRREGRAALWARVAELHAVEGAVPSVVNQGLMELGATVCTPKAPRCDRCPLARACLGRDVASELPRKPPRKEVATIRLLALVDHDERGVPLLVRRPVEGLFGGLWEPPMARLDDGADPVSAAVALGARDPARAATVVHVLTHRRLVVEVVTASALGDPPDSWCTYVEERRVSDLDGVGLSELARRVLRAASALALPLAAEPPLRG